MFKLMIDNEHAELTASTRLQLNRLVLDLSDISLRGMTISNMLMLPFTSKNDRLTGFPSRLNSNNKAFETTRRYAVVEQNNIISQGSVIVQGFSEKQGIKVQLAEGFSFWDVVGKRKLNDLDLFAYDVVFNATTFAAINTKTASPWLWALASNASDPTQTALTDLVYSRPSYRHKRILDEIVEQSGYAVDYGDLLETSIIDDIGSLGNTRDFSVTDYKLFYEAIVIAPGDIDLTGATLEFSLAGNTTLSGTTDLINSLYKTSYVVKGVVRSNFDTTIAITSVLGGETVEETISIVVGVNEVNYRTDEFEIGSTTTFSVADELIFESVRVYAHINESDIVDVAGAWDAGGGISIVEDFQILTDYNLPFLTQLEFFKTIIKQLFLKIDIDEPNKVVYLSSFADVLSTNNIIDLTGKLEKFPEVTSGNAFAQLNIIKYENDEDISETLGQAIFSVANESAPANSIYLDVPQFSSSKQILISGNTTVDVPIYSIADNSRDSVKHRIVEFIDGSGIPFTCRFTGVSWQQLYKDNYLSFINSIKRERSLNANIYLSMLDLNRINDTPIAYIGELGGNFLILDVSGFEVGEFSNVKMVKYG